VTCSTLEGLIRNAYLLYPDGKPWVLPTHLYETFQPIKGSSGWINSARFTINANSNVPASLEMMRGPMMQALLRDRFKLRIHREAREYPAYDLAVAPGGHKLQPAKPGDCVELGPNGPPSQAPGKPFCGGIGVPRSGKTSGLDANGITMSGFCVHLSQWLDRDVLDKTGLKGKFAMHLEISFADISRLRRERQSIVDESQSSLAASIPEPSVSVPSVLRKVGLVLKPTRVLGSFIVIDHAEKPGTN
jgi:uncharacterized protein (TIGR03435 family)